MGESAGSPASAKAPAYGDEAGKAAFREAADALFGGSAYDAFVPDEYEEVEGERRDLDDWDVWKVNLQNTISEDGFWDQVFDRLLDDFDDGEEIDAARLKSWMEAAGGRIAEEALGEYEPDKESDILVHRGVDKGEAYWRS